MKERNTTTIAATILIALTTVGGLLLTGATNDTDPATIWSPRTSITVLTPHQAGTAVKLAINWAAPDLVTCGQGRFFVLPKGAENHEAIHKQLLEAAAHRREISIGLENHPPRCVGHIRAVRAFYE